MWYRALGLLALLNAIGFAINLAFFRSEQLACLLLITSSPGLLLAKQFARLGQTSWRWDGLIGVSPKLITAWRWSLRIFLLTMVGVGFVAVIAPEILPKVQNPARFIGVLGDLFGMFCNLWFCGFVLFGDETVKRRKGWR